MHNAVTFAYNARAVFPGAVQRPGPWAVALFRGDVGESALTSETLSKLRAHGCSVTVLDVADEVRALRTAEQRAHRREFLLGSFHSAVVDIEEIPPERLCALLAHPDMTLPVAVLDPTGRLQDPDSLSAWFGRTLRGAVVGRIHAVRDADAVIDVVFQDAIAKARRILAETRFPDDQAFLRASKLISGTIGDTFWERFNAEYTRRVEQNPRLVIHAYGSSALSHLAHLHRVCGIGRPKHEIDGAPLAVTLSCSDFLFAARSGGLSSVRALTLFVDWTFPNGIEREWRALVECKEAAGVLSQLDSMVVWQWGMDPWPIDLSTLPNLRHLALFAYDEGHLYDWGGGGSRIQVSGAIPNGLRTLTIERLWASAVPADLATRVIVEAVDSNQEWLRRSTAE